MRTFIFTLFSFLLGAVSVHAAERVQVSQAEFLSHANHLEFRLTVEQPFSMTKVSARYDDTLMVFEIDGGVAERRWVSVDDQVLSRVLLHTTSDNKKAALRVRFASSVTESMLKNVRYRFEDNVFIAAIPKTEKIAEGWAAHAQKTVVAKKNAEEKPSENTALLDDSEQPVFGVQKAKAIVPSEEETAEKLENPSEALKSNPAELAAGIASAETDQGPVFLVALVLMLGTGLVLMKKMRNGKPASEGGPLIRPVSSHMLGPKQGLLLVEVAGEMVLLGTTEKGVQLLTKIDQENVAEFVSSSRNATDSTAVTSQTESNPFGKMLAQFRDASDKLRSVSPEKRSKKSSALDELSVLGDNDTGYDRRKFKPVAPRAAVPAYQAQPALQEKDTLIEKLRMLREA